MRIEVILNILIKAFQIAFCANALMIAIKLVRLLLMKG